VLAFLKASPVKRLLHLTLTPGSLLHGITELCVLILLLHLSVNLLHECSPLADLASALSSLGHLSCLGHYTYSEEIILIVRLTQNVYIAWKHRLFSAAAVQRPEGYLIVAALQIPQEHNDLRIPVIRYAWIPLLHALPYFL